MVEAEPVDETDLGELAAKRAETVHDALKGEDSEGGETGAPPERVSIGAAGTTDVNESGWVPMELEIRI